MGWVLALAGALAAAGPALASEPDKGVAAYLADGYAIAEKREEERQVPGLPPYEQMKRVLHVTTYRLERGGEAVVCEVTYDSQRDTISTACQ